MSDPRHTVVLLVSYDGSEYVRLEAEYDEGKYPEAVQKLSERLLGLPDRVARRKESIPPPATMMELDPPPHANGPSSPDEA